MEIAWATGFWDGEGTICVGHMVDRDGSDRWYVIATVEQMHDRRCVDRFHKAVGVGKVYGPYEKQYRGSALLRFQWRLAGYENVRAFADRLWPYLSEPKREQIERTFAHPGVGPDKRHGPRARCRRGEHEMSGDNLIVKPDGKRSCRACANAAQQRRRASR